MIIVISLVLVPLLAAATIDPHSDAIAACANLNLTMQLSLMRGYGLIDGYSRNSGCGDVCGRATYRWDNGPQGFGDNVKPGTLHFPHPPIRMHLVPSP